MIRDLFAGRTLPEIVGTGLAALEILAACTLIQFATTPTEIALCGIVAVLALCAFALYLGDD